MQWPLRPLQHWGRPASIVQFPLGALRPEGFGTPDDRKHGAGKARETHVTKNRDFSRKMLRSGTALQALALLGAGVGAVALTATSAAAQDYTNINASGKVQGTDGKAIAGATVTLTSNDQGNTQVVTTDSSGSFRSAQLRPGSYTITIEASGYDTFTDSNVVLTQSASANQFTLAAAGGSGDIVITAGRVKIADFTQNTTGAVINIGELATRVPVARDITSIVLLAPGTIQGDTAFGNVPSIAGASVSENTYYINGLNITNFRNGIGAVPVPFDFYQSVEVKNGGFGAEFGRATGGFINATTKSGSNEFHASVTFNWEPDKLNSDSPNTYATDNDSAYAERREFIAQFSGPIIKDHLFFYGLYQSRNVKSAVGSTGTIALTATGACTSGGVANQLNTAFCTPYPGPAGVSGTVAAPINFGLQGTGYSITTNNSPFYGGKIDAVIVDGQRLEFTYFNTESLSTVDTYGTSLWTVTGGRYNPVTNDPGRYTSTSLQRAGGENYVGRYTGTFTEWLTVSAAYGRSYNRSTTESSTPGAPSIVDQRSGASVSIGNPTANTSTAFDKREFYRADVDLYVNFLGSHHFRGGYDREDLSNRSSTLANGNYQLTYLNSGAAGDGRVATPNTQYVTRRFFRNGGSFSTKGEAFYLQDSWSLFDKRLTLNLGVRDDRFTNENAVGEKFFVSGDNWAPRLGFSFDVFGNGRTKVYGSFNRYFLPVATNTNVRLAGPELDYTQYYVLTGVNADNTPIYGAPIAIIGGGRRACPAGTVDFNGAPATTVNCTVNSDGTTPPYRSLVSANLQAQSQDEYILGIEQRMGSRWKFGAYYTQRDLRQSLEDAYIDAGIQAYCRRTLTGAALAECLSNFTGAHQYALLNPGQDVQVVADGGGAAIDGKLLTLSAADLGLPQAQRKFKAVTLTVDREFDGVWSFSASYTWSTLKGNIEGGVRSDNGQTDSGLTTNFDYPALVNGAYGFLPGHRRHNFKAYGSYQIGKWLNIGANVQVTSPRKFGCIGRVPNYVDGGSAGAYGAAGFYCNTDASGNVLTNPVTNPVSNPASPGNASPAGTLRLTPRGSQFQSDWLYNVGLDVALRIPTDKFDGTLRLSVFNVLNTKGALDFQEVGTATNGTPSPNYGLPLSYQTPRYVRFQFSVGF